MNRHTRSNDERLLEVHQLHLGLYARVAKRLSVTPSYVSRVARGQRENDKVTAQLLDELRKLR
jgi:transcriptional regulator with XRE-family HTH domain